MFNYRLSAHVFHTRYHLQMVLIVRLLQLFLADMSRFNNRLHVVFYQLLHSLVAKTYKVVRHLRQVLSVADLLVHMLAVELG